MNIILKELRKTRGYTQEEVALSIHVSRQTISNWERGISTPDLENLKILSNFYNVDISKILGSEVNYQKSPVLKSEKNKQLTYFLFLLAICSLVTPLAAFILLYLTLSLKEIQSKIGYCFLKSYSLILIVLNLILIFIFLVHIL